MGRSRQVPSLAKVGSNIEIIGVGRWVDPVPGAPFDEDKPLLDASVKPGDIVRRAGYRLHKKLSSHSPLLQITDQEVGQAVLIDHDDDTLSVATRLPLVTPRGVPTHYLPVNIALESQSLAVREVVDNDPAYFFNAVVSKAVFSVVNGQLRRPLEFNLSQELEAAQ